MPGHGGHGGHGHGGRGWGRGGLYFNDLYPYLYTGYPYLYDDYAALLTQPTAYAADKTPKIIAQILATIQGDPKLSAAEKTKLTTLLLTSLTKK